MDFKKLKPIMDAYGEIQEKAKMDPVDSKELKGKFADRKDKDIDNDGDVDSSDEYLHNRRKTIKKAIKKNDDKSETEIEVSEESMTDAQKKKREKYVLAMKDKMPEFKKKYGDRAKEVMYATATKMAMKEEVEQINEKQGSKEHLARLLAMLDKAKPGSADHSQIRGAISSMFGDKHIPAKHRNVKTDMYEEADLDEAYQKSLGYKGADDMINRLSKLLTPNSALAKGISRDADNVVPEFKKMQKHMEAIQDIWDEVERTVSMSEGVELEEEDRSQRYKGATKPEMMADKMTASDKNFAEPHGSLDGNDSGIDGGKAAQDTAASIKSSGKKAATRPNDKNIGDKNAETPMDVTRKAGVKEAKTFSELLKALGGLND